MKKLLFISFLILFNTTLLGQVTRYISFGKQEKIENYGKVIPIRQEIIINFNDSTIKTGDETFIILNRENWVRNKIDYEYITIDCADEFFNKVFIRVIRYRNEKKIIILVLRRNKTIRYIVPCPN